MTNDEATEALLAALEAGDYRAALAAYRATDNSREAVGKPVEAFLLAIAGEHAAAARLMSECRGADVIEAIVRGERERAQRWTDPQAASGLSSPVPAHGYVAYASLQLALVAGDANAIERELLPQVRAIPPVTGTLRLRSGDVVPFQSLVDSDDAIGAMLECYTAAGLMYVPFASLRRVTFAQPRSFVDALAFRAEGELVDGRRLSLIVPMLYAQSSTASEPTVRTGRTTLWTYVGGARRGAGQRDLVVDGGRMIGIERVALIEFDHRDAHARAPSPAQRAPLPAAHVATTATTRRSRLTRASLLFSAVLLVVLLALRLC